MIEIQCPRCERYWYSEDPEGGRVRLCDRCTADLGGARHRTRASPDAFLFAVGGLLLADALLITLTALWPRVFGVVLVLFGAILFLIGGRWLRRVIGFGHIGDVDWTTGRWPALFVLAGIACLLAFFTFVIRPSRNQTGPRGTGHRPVKTAKTAVRDPLASEAPTNALRA